MKKLMFFVILFCFVIVSNVIASKPFVDSTCGVPALLAYRVLSAESMPKGEKSKVNAKPLSWVTAILEGQRGGDHVSELAQAFECAFQSGKPLPPVKGAMIGPALPPSTTPLPGSWIGDFKGADPLRFAVASYLKGLHVATPPSRNRLYSFASVAPAKEGKGQEVQWSDPRTFAEGEDALLDAHGNVIASVACGNPCKDLGRDQAISLPSSRMAPSGDKKSGGSSDSGDDDEEEERPRRRRRREREECNETLRVKILPDGTVIEGGK